MAWIMSLFTHTPDNKLFKAPQREVSRVFLHCSASDNPAHDVVVIKRWHTSPDPKDPSKPWKDIGYHYVITFDGRIQLGRDLEITPAAQGKDNPHTIAICLQGGQNGKPTAFTEVQFDTLRALCRAIARELPNVTFHPHNEVAPHKTCPVFNVRDCLLLDSKGKMTV